MKPSGSNVALAMIVDGCLSMKRAMGDVAGARWNRAETERRRGGTIGGLSRARREPEHAVKAASPTLGRHLSTEIGVADARIRPQRRRRTIEHDAAGLQDIGVMLSLIHIPSPRD